MHAYVGRAGAGMRIPWGNGWVRWQGVSQVASGRLHPGTAWCVPMLVRLVHAYAGRAGAGMCIPWGNERVRQQGVPQVASGRLHPGACLRGLGWHAVQACAYPMYDWPENLWGCYTAAADE